MNLMDKAVLELGAGTGLLSIVASLLGKFVFPCFELIIFKFLKRDGWILLNFSCFYWLITFFIFLV